LHRSQRVVTPGADTDPGQSAVAGREQCGMPAEQALGRQLTGVLLRGIEDHVDDAFDIPVGGSQSTDVHPQPAGERRANRIGVECFPLDLARLEYVLGPYLEAGLLAQPDAEILQAPEQAALRLMHPGQRLRQPLMVETPVRPIVLLPDEALDSVIHAGIVRVSLGRVKTTAAYPAAINQPIRRMR
jgi:hypothetical protein